MKLKLYSSAFVMMLTMTDCLAYGVCSVNRGDAAERSASPLRTWGELYAHHKSFPECENDRVLLMYSQSINFFLTSKWDRLDELRGIVKMDPSFESFVLNRIRPAMTPVTQARIRKFAMNSCRAGREAACNKIVNAIK